MKYWIAALLLTAGMLHAEEICKLKVDPGEVTRINSPMTASVDVKLPAKQLFLLDPEAGALVRVQVEQGEKSTTLRWIAPKIEAGKPVTYSLISADDAKEKQFKFVEGDGTRDLVYGDDTPIWRDMIKYDPADRANTFKPYKHVYAFDAKDGFITHSPGGLYTHHRGIFFGFKAFHGETLLGDFWHCPDVTQRHAKYLADREFVGPVVARDAEVVNWVAKDDKAVVRDTREVTTWRVSPTDYVLDYTITVENLTDEPIKLSADAHHAGFHFRAAQSVAGTKPNGSDGTATYLRNEGATLAKNDIWEKEDWAHVMFPIGEKKYAVTHFDAPSNFRPIQYSTRPYGRVGSFFITDVAKDKPLVLHYRLRIRNGEPAATPEQLATEYKDYSAPVKVTVEK